MFDRLVVSTVQRRRGRTTKFFLFTSGVYLSVIAVALGLSVLLAEPRLADGTNRDEMRIISLPLSGTRPRTTATHNRDSHNTPRPDPLNVMKFDDIAGQKQSGPPRIKLPDEIAVGPTDDFGSGNPNGIPNGIGTISPPTGGGRAADAPPPVPPDPPKPQPRRAETNKPLPVSSIVLQGKAIARIVPVYPELPRKIRMPGEVSVEVIISPEGKVESSRVVSGHPMFVTAALQAARGWRFEPTFLNGVAVRVTGVITFVFKLNE